MSKDNINQKDVNIEKNILGILAEICQIAEDADRDKSDVNLLAVSKFHPIEAVKIALKTGHRLFGENRVQEAISKYVSLKAEYTDLRLHLIGPLQTNKVREAISLFNVIETLDRPRLAEALSKELNRIGSCPDLYIQVNTGEEAQKSGVFPSDLDKFVKFCCGDLGLPVTGLMCIPPLEEEPAMHFALLAEMARRNNLKYLSMGMSSDFKTAIKMGATHVRVGTAIFGARTVMEQG